MALTTEGKRSSEWLPGISQEGLGYVSYCKRLGIVNKADLFAIRVTVYDEDTQYSIGSSLTVYSEDVPSDWEVYQKIDKAYAYINIDGDFSCSGEATREIERELTGDTDLPYLDSVIIYIENFPTECVDKLKRGRSISMAPDKEITKKHKFKITLMGFTKAWNFMQEHIRGKTN